MKPVQDYIARLHTAATGSQRVTEADVIREVQADAFQSGYAQAARELLGIAMESQDRTDSMLAGSERVLGTSSLKSN